MLSHVALLPLLALTALATPPKNLDARALTIPDANEAGSGLEAMFLNNASESANFRPFFSIKFYDGLKESANKKIIEGSAKSAGCTVYLKNFKSGNGKPTIDLPGPNNPQTCAINPAWTFAFSTANSGTGFTLTMTHAVTINNGAPLIRTTSLSIPALSAWKATKIGNGVTNYNLEPYGSPRYIVATTTTNAPAGFSGRKDNYSIN